MSPDSRYADGRIAEEAIRRLRGARAKPAQPFFIAVGILKPHLPFVAPKRYWDLYDRASFDLPERRVPPAGAPEFAPTTWGELRQYRDMPPVGPLTDDRTRELIHGYHAAVSYVDAQIGRLLGELDRLGLDHETIVVIWGDHGWHLGDHGMWCKHTNYEQATRMKTVVLLLSLAFSLGSAGAAPMPKPNVLFLAADDLRCDLGCYGNPAVKTPNLDRLARRGLVFNRAYCQQALCNPSRASLLTGRRVDSLGVWDLPTHFRTAMPKVVTLPQHFKNNGYFTQNIGKIFHNWIHDIQGDPASWSVPAVMHFARHDRDQPVTAGPQPPNLAADPKCECRDVPDEAYFDGRIAQLAIKARRRPWVILSAPTASATRNGATGNPVQLSPGNSTITTWMPMKHATWRANRNTPPMSPRAPAGCWSSSPWSVPAGSRPSPEQAHKQL